MSNSIFPTFNGLTYSVTKTPNWATRMQRSISGRELRVFDYTNPIWNFTLIFSVLRDFAYGSFGASATEIRTAMNFFNTLRGSFDTFLLNDPDDNSVLLQPIGTGDGVETAFQLVRSLITAGFKESIIAPNVVAAIYDNGSPVSSGDYTVNSATGIVTFTTAPVTGHAITADFTFYFRVKFASDSIDFEQFMHQLWEVKQLKLTSVLL